MPPKQWRGESTGSDESKHVKSVAADYQNSFQYLVQDSSQRKVKSWITASIKAHVFTTKVETKPSNISVSTCDTCKTGNKVNENSYQATAGTFTPWS
mmetsp:Transcript_16175/g.21790  ORF Transcript_16175/g.21790 Transcript_16175/m.21790 type:complete len:97 (-) Transcript_16175:444-734(-)